MLAALTTARVYKTLMTNLSEMLSIHKFTLPLHLRFQDLRSLVPTPGVSNPLKNRNNNETSMWTKSKKQVSESTAQVPPLEDHDETVQEPNSLEPNSYQPKLPYHSEYRRPEKFLIPCALQELDRTNALADSGASINLLPHSIYKQLGLGALKPTRMTQREFEFIYSKNFTRWRPFLRTAKALIDLYEEKLTLRVGSDELVFYAEKSEKSKNKQFAHAISVIDFLKDEPFSGSTTNHFDALPPSSSPVKTSDNLEEFTDELTLLKKVVHEENFQVYSNPLFEFDDNFTSSNVNPLFNEMDEDVKIKNSNVSDSDKVECFAPEDDIDEIDVF
ncbi:reverse transcriptase domain-containing protein [Tanacetum coccineum]